MIAVITALQPFAGHLIERKNVSRLPLHPSHPERICWGCDKNCSAGDLACGNGTIRTLHPSELFGDDWLEWSDREPGESSASAPSTQARYGAMSRRSLRRRRTTKPQTVVEIVQCGEPSKTDSTDATAVIQSLSRSE